ncbi:unnamed protein product [Staurois parvus]|uniref:Iodothyronine deiodinase n=1 Tax=Staurois parvus TaxID=386267 RepID=A0ABN9HHV5_9NEOB|nr:unnamed protein product [Staurois parvus]
MENLCSAKYAALPERLYILQEGKIIYKGNMGPWGYKPEEVRSVLENKTLSGCHLQFNSHRRKAQH